MSIILAARCTMNDVTYSDLRRARSSVLRRAGRKAPGKGSMDTLTPMVKLGLEVVEFEVAGTMEFAREITSKNLHRISVAQGNYAVNLFTAAIGSGIVYGAAAEQRRTS
jgi:hypothetical protein